MNQLIKAIVITLIWVVGMAYISYQWIYFSVRSNSGLDELTVMGLGSYDIVLLIFCPICCSLGLSVSTALKKHYHGDDAVESPSPIVGLVLGLVVALYFIGTIQNDISAIARILALSILLGYQAPNIWYSQEKAIKKIIDKRLSDVEKK